MKCGGGKKRVWETPRKPRGQYNDWRNANTNKIRDMYVFQNMSINDIAYRLGYTPNVIHCLIYRIRKAQNAKFENK